LPRDLILVLKRHMNKPLTCVFVPYWRANPYQDELAKALESQGIVVDKTCSLKRAFNRTLLGGNRPDIIHVHWLPPFAWGLVPVLRLIFFVGRLCVLRVSGVILVLTVHNLRPHESRSPRGDWLVCRTVIALTQAVIVHSKTARREVVSTFCLPTCENRILVIPHGNYLQAYANKIERAAARARLGISDARTVMLFLGQIRPYKGVLELIAAFRQLRERRANAGLVIAGQPLTEELSRTIAAEVGRCQAIRYEPRFVPEDEVQVYLNACDVVVFPYRQVLSSGAVILAMSFARACVAPRLGCILDVLDDTGAFLYDSQDERGLLDALTAACVRQAELQGMGEYNRRNEASVPIGSCRPPGRSASGRSAS
jgi:beta-1,4-mannosyltransferase